MRVDVLGRIPDDGEAVARDVGLGIGWMSVVFCDPPTTVGERGRLRLGVETEERARIPVRNDRARTGIARAGDEERATAEQRGERGDSDPRPLLAACAKDHALASGPR